MTDLVTSSLGGGIAGQAADQYLRRSSTSRRRALERKVSLPVGTRMQLFLHEEIQAER